MFKRTRLALLLGATALSGCYRADITTGLTPSGVVVEDEWVLGFVGGLAMVDDVDAAACTNGIARVMTRQSFLNLVVNVLTWGIVTPMEVRVECASAPASAANLIESGSSPDEVEVALQSAAAEAVESGETVYIRFAD